MIDDGIFHIRESSVISTTINHVEIFAGKECCSKCGRVEAESGAIPLVHHLPLQAESHSYAILLAREQYGYWDCDQKVRIFVSDEEFD
jgi:hypothetical protein